MLNVRLTDDGNEVVALLKDLTFGLTILDYRMPDMDILRLFKKLDESKHLPVILLSLEKGALPLENGQTFLKYSLVERGSRIILGNLMLDRTQSVLYRSGKPVSLTSTEYKIVELLMRQPGLVFTKKRIYEEVWEDSFLQDDNCIMVHINKIRCKIEDNSRRPRYLKTVWRLGYKMEAP